MAVPGAKYSQSTPFGRTSMRPADAGPARRTNASRSTGDVTSIRAEQVGRARLEALGPPQVEPGGQALLPSCGASRRLLEQVRDGVDRVEHDRQALEARDQRHAPQVLDVQHVELPRCRPGPPDARAAPGCRA